MPDQETEVDPEFEPMIHRLARMAAFFLVVACASLSADAQQGNRPRELFERLDANSDRLIERSEIPPSAVPAFEKLLAAVDENHNGKLELEEFRRIAQATAAKAPNPTATTDRLAILDADKDGKVSRAEFRGASAAFDRLDSNKDGFLTREELPGVGAGAAKSPPAKGKPAVKGKASSAVGEKSPKLGGRDKNGDGKLSRAEFPGRPALFERLDRDGDGSLSAGEFAPYLERMQKSAAKPKD